MLLEQLPLPFPSFLPSLPQQVITEQPLCPGLCHRYWGSNTSLSNAIPLLMNSVSNRHLCWKPVFNQSSRFLIFNKYKEAAIKRENKTSVSLLSTAHRHLIFLFIGLQEKKELWASIYYTLRNGSYPDQQCWKMLMSPLWMEPLQGTLWLEFGDSGGLRVTEAFASPSTPAQSWAGSPGPGAQGIFPVYHRDGFTGVRANSAGPVQVPAWELLLWNRMSVRFPFWVQGAGKKVWTALLPKNGKIDTCYIWKEWNELMEEKRVKRKGESCVLMTSFDPSIRLHIKQDILHKMVLFMSFVIGKVVISKKFRWLLTVTCESSWKDSFLILTYYLKGCVCTYKSKYTVCVRQWMFLLKTWKISEEEFWEEI